MRHDHHKHCLDDSSGVDTSNAASDGWTTIGGWLYATSALWNITEPSV
jgi:hypothetical protein